MIPGLPQYHHSLIQFPILYNITSPASFVRKARKKSSILLHRPSKMTSSPSKSSSLRRTASRAHKLVRPKKLAGRRVWSRPTTLASGHRSLFVWRGRRQEEGETDMWGL